MKHFVIVGATSSIAEHCARLWVAEEALELTLLARDAVRAEAVAADLRVRSPESTVHTATLAFTDPGAIEAWLAALYDRAPVDIALIAHGSLPDQAACERDLHRTTAELEINGLSPALFAEAFALKMQEQDHGQLAIIGSVAGDRGRKSNYVYGAAKGLLERYAQGLQHRLAGTDVHVSLVKPGPTLTPMTAHLTDSGPGLADVQAVARVIVNGLRRRKAVIYAPGKWRLIMLIIRHLPRFIFNRLDI
ncbi:SDR family NAD(P)-dependent oxidoreductase [Halieaceae bacterium]|nr:SDR family NAD(P)-dependent oxidoreductase [Halieaceae bacterium]